MEIIKLNKGADKICYKGYMCTLKYADQQYYTWSHGDVQKKKIHLIVQLF